MVPPTMLMVPLTLFQDSTTKCPRFCHQYFYGFINTNNVQGSLIARGFVCTWFHPHCSQFHQNCPWFSGNINRDSSPKWSFFHEFCSRLHVWFHHIETITNGSEIRGHGSTNNAHVDINFVSRFNHQISKIMSPMFLQFHQH